MIFTVTVEAPAPVSLFDQPQYLLAARQIARDPRCVIKGVVARSGNPDGYADEVEFSIEAPTYDEVAGVIRAAIEDNLGSVHRTVNDLAGQAALAAT